MRLVPATTRARVLASAVAMSTLQLAAVPAAQADEVYPRPVITSVTPASGPVAGGNTIVVRGTDLAGVWFAGVGESGATIVDNTDDSLTLLVPPATAPGKVDVTLTTIGGAADNTAADDYTYVGNGGPGPNPQPTKLPVVSSLAPNVGLSYIGGVTFIAGKNLTGITSIKFGNTAAKFTPVTATRVLVVAPRLPRGTYKVTVTTKAGANTTGATYRYIGL